MFILWQELVTVSKTGLAAHVVNKLAAPSGRSLINACLEACASQENNVQKYFKLLPQQSHRLTCDCDFYVPEKCGHLVNTSV